MGVHIIDIKYLNYIVTIAEEKNLHSAAEKLFISQPSLSYYLGKLEEELGTPLFIRTTKGLVPTEAGNLYVQNAKSIINMRNQMYRDIRNLSYQDHLSLASTSFWGKRIYEAVTIPFKKQHPNTMLEISETYFPYMNTRLNNHEFDICLASIVDIEFSHYNTIILGNEDIVMVISSSHPFCGTEEAKAEHITCETLTRCFPEDDFLFTSKGSTSRQLTEKLFDELHFYPRIYGYFDSVTTIRKLVAAGTGVSFLPASSIVPPVDDVRCFLIEPRLLRKHVLAYRKELVMTPIVKDLFNLIIEQHELL